MVDDDGAALRGAARGDVADHAVGRSEDARTFGDGVIDSLMGLQGLVEGVYAHAVGGGQQGELLVDDGLNRGDVVASAADGVDAGL